MGGIQDTFFTTLLIIFGSTLVALQQQGTVANVGLEASDETTSGDSNKDKNINPNEAEQILMENAKNFKIANDGSHLINRLGLFKEVKVYSIRYKLYNMNSPGEVITYTNNMSSTKWNPGQNVVFVIHGWMQTAEQETNRDIEVAFGTSINIKDAYIGSNRTENVILVNWEDGAGQLNFIKSARESYVVGKAVAHMIISLKTRDLITYSQVKIVGFSMGAHVAGVAGYFIYDKLKTKIGEITGLDPLGNYFDNDKRPLKVRLDSSDAEFVQVIHCNMGQLLWPPFDPHFGTTQILGHVDFYPNGGVDQPECPQSIKAMANLCSHFRCSELYASSVRGLEYRGCLCENAEAYLKDKCNTCNGPLMGDLCPKNAAGKYYLKAMPHKLDQHQGM